MTSSTEIDLAHHGDAELADGLLDVAVNVSVEGPPGWLRQVLAEEIATLAAYPDQRAALSAVAERHARHDLEVLLTAGAAEAFVLLARTLQPRRAVVVHPQFTEPEAALRAAGHLVERVLLSADNGFRLVPELVPADADLVVVGNPTNPTGQLHAAQAVGALARRGRTLVVDEAFMDFVPGAAESLAGRGDLPGLVVVRSLTKAWGLAGLRIGYLLAAEPVVARLRAAQPLWPVSSLACAAAVACSRPAAVREQQARANALAQERARYAVALGSLPGLRVVPGAAANFLLIAAPGRPDLHGRLRARGVAARRCDSFPGLSAEWLRLAIRDRATNTRVLNTLSAELANPRSPR